MRVAIASDHGGFDLKQSVLEYLKENEIEYTDFGCYNLDSVDYPDYAVPVCGAVLSGEADKGILICGTGIGISISANKIKGIRCALCHDVFSAKATRQHNDAQVIALGGRVIGAGHAVEVVDAFLHTDFSRGERHARRVRKIMDIEKKR